MKIVKFKCGCIGFRLDPAQQFHKERTCICLKRCDADFDEPTLGFYPREFDGMLEGEDTPLTPEETEALAKSLERVIGDGFHMGTVRALLKSYD